MDLEEYAERMKELTRLSKEKERTAVRLEEVRKRLKKAAGTDDLEKAKKRAARIRKELQEGVTLEERLKRRWDKRWKDKLAER